jgi:predicted amidohydrolase YtcJ
MATAVDRAGLVRAEALSPSEALDLFTTAAATAIGEDARLGPEAPATFTVLDIDPTTATPAEVRGTDVVATWVDGKSIGLPSGPAWVG